MDRTSGDCRYFNLERVIYGPGTVKDLGEELSRVGATRAVVATGGTLAASALLRQVTDAMGACCVGVFKGTAQHGPVSTAEDLAAEMRRLDADAIVSFGGGSPIDTAKVAVAAVISGRPVAELASENLRQFADLGNGSRDIPHIALPTTLSAGEFTPGGAVTSAQGIKEGVVSPRLEIRTVIYDPGLTQATGDLLWASTGLRALDHAVEAIYSARGQSFTDALAVKAAKLLFDHLPGSIGAEGEDRQVHRGQCQVAAWLSNYAALNTGYGLSHAISHKIGPKWEVAHGVTSCVGLPVAMRFMAERAPERFQPLADALGVAFDTALPTAGAMACIDLVEALISALGLPRTLKDVGVEVTDLGELVDDIHREINMFGAVGLPVSREDISGLLHRM